VEDSLRGGPRELGTFGTLFLADTTWTGYGQRAVSAETPSGKCSHGCGHADSHFQSSCFEHHYSPRWVGMSTLYYYLYTKIIIEIVSYVSKYQKHSFRAIFEWFQRTQLTEMGVSEAVLRVHMRVGTQNEAPTHFPGIA